MSKGSNFRSFLRITRSLAGLICIAVCFQVAMPGSLFAQDPALVSCLSWIDKGAYPSGIEQEGCEANYDLPDPFAITCLSRVDQNHWSDKIERTACYLLLTDLITRQYADYPQEMTHLSVNDP